MLKLGVYLSVQAHKPCSISHMCPSVLIIQSNWSFFFFFFFFFADEMHVLFNPLAYN